MKKVIALLLAVLTLLTAVAACAEQQDVRTYTMAGSESAEDRDWNTNAFFRRMEEKTGIGFTFIQKSTSGEWHNYLESLKKEGADLPHVLFKADLYGYEIIELYQAGILTDLTPYLEECCPNLCALLDQYPDVKEAITVRIDGNDVIPALPYINETPVNCGIWVNKNWLKSVRMEIDEITTREKFEEMLYKFKQFGDVPLGFLGSFDLKFLAHMWGLYGNNYNMYLDEQGNACFMPEDGRFYDFVLTMRKWYSDGLLDKDGYIKTDSLRQITSTSAKNPYGIIITTSVTNILPAEWNKDYVMLAPIAYEGKVYYRDYYGHAIPGTFALTKACTEEEKKNLLQWVDYLYSPEGAVLESVGVKDSEFVVLGDSTDTVDVNDMLCSNIYQWSLMNESSSTALLDTRTDKLITGGTNVPGYSVDAFQKLYSNSEVREMFVQQERLNSVATRPFPYYTLNRSDLAFISKLQNGEDTAKGIGYEVDEQMALWILGEEDLTKDSFDAFIRHLYDDLNLQTFKEFWQGIADGIKQ